MKNPSLSSALNVAVEATQAAGELMRRNHRLPKKVNESSRHDIKLELDVRCQERIERLLQRAFPNLPILGEEGITGDPESPWRWVVDPIDGTVNFAREIPHCCSVVALQKRTAATSTESRREAEFQTMLGVVYDPFCDELWTAVRGRRAKLNGRAIQVSSHTKLQDCLVSVGFAKEGATLRRMLPTLQDLLPRVRKVRIMGSAALALTYVASGRLDAYIEFGLRIWDVAAGGLILECAGGDYWNRALPQPYTYHIVASNGRLSRALRSYRA